MPDLQPPAPSYIWIIIAVSVVIIIGLIWLAIASAQKEKPQKEFHKPKPEQPSVEKDKRGSYNWLIIILVAVIGLCAFVVYDYYQGTQSEQTPTYTTPTYTADQVIAIARAKYPVGFKQEIIGQDSGGLFRSRTVETPTMISVTYIGGSGGAWEVKISLPRGYHFEDRTYGTKTLYFYESNSSLRDTYYP